MKNCKECAKKEQMLEKLHLVLDDKEETINHLFIQADLDKKTIAELRQQLIRKDKQEGISKMERLLYDIAKMHGANIDAYFNSYKDTLADYEVIWMLEDYVRNHPNTIKINHK